MKNIIINNNKLIVGKLNFTSNGDILMNKLRNFDSILHSGLSKHPHLMYKYEDFFFTWNFTHSSGPIVTKKLVLHCEHIAMPDIMGQSVPQYIVKPGFKWSVDAFNIKIDQIHVDFLNKNMMSLKSFAEKQLLFFNKTSGLAELSDFGYNTIEGFVDLVSIGGKFLAVS